MKKLCFISLCILAGLIIFYIISSTPGQSAYDSKNTSPPEGEKPVVKTNESDTNTATENVSQKEDPTSSAPPVVPEHVGKYHVQSALSTEKTIYAYGFYYEPLPAYIIKKITGVSYHENDNISYDDLRYVTVLYVDFDGISQKGELICNKAIAQDLVEIFKELYDNRYPIDKIRLIDEYGGDDDLSCDDNNTSCFNYRVVGGTDNLSKHALGLAIDINPFQNPYITYPNGVERISPAGSEPYADRDSGLAHMILEGDLCYTLFTERGFTWGGHWKTLKDYQHFQKTF